MFQVLQVLFLAPETTPEAPETDPINGRIYLAVKGFLVNSMGYVCIFTLGAALHKAKRTAKTAKIFMIDVVSCVCVCLCDTTAICSVFANARCTHSTQKRK